MAEMLKYKWVILPLLAWASAVFGGDFPIYPSKGALGLFVDKEGYAFYPVKVADVDFGAGVKLPFVLTFSGKNVLSSGEFGTGWHSSLLEAGQYNVTARSIAVEMVGGKTLYLYQSKDRNSLEFVHPSGEWVGVENGHNFTLTGKDGVVIKYRDGMIEGIKMSDGREFEWIRRGEIVGQIKEKGQAKPLLALVEERGNSRVYEINGKKYEVSRDPVSLGVGKVAWPSGKSLVLKREAAVKGDPRLMGEWSGGRKDMLSWDAATGYIKGYNDWKYTITPIYKTDIKTGKSVVEAGTWPKMERTNGKTGVKEGYFYNTKTGVVEELRADGSVKKIYEIMTPGPAYRKMRLVELVEKGKTTTLARYNYREDGSLEKMLSWDPDLGKMILNEYDAQERLSRVLVEGIAVLENQYGKEGELISKSIPVSVVGGKVKALAELASVNQPGSSYLNQMQGEDKGGELLEGAAQSTGIKK